MILFRQILISQRNLIAQTFVCQLFRGRNKNHFFYYFGLLRDLLHRHNLTKKWFEARLKCMAMFLSIFRKRISPLFNQIVFIVRITELTSKWLWTFRLSIISISCTLAESSIWCFLSVAFIENSKSYQLVTTTSTSYSRKPERSVAETSIHFVILPWNQYQSHQDQDFP